MKKIALILLVFLTGFVLSGCNEDLELNPDFIDMKSQISSLEEQLLDLDKLYSNLESALEAYETITSDYQKRIVKLEEDLFDLEAEYKSVESSLKSLRADTLSNEREITLLENKLLNYDLLFDSLTSELIDLETKTTDHLRRIADLERERTEMLAQISSLESELDGFVDPEVKVFLPEQYYLAPNDNFQLFYRSVIQAVNPYIYHIKLTGTVGHSYNRYFEWKPEAAHDGRTFDLKIEVRDVNGNVLGSASTKLVVSSANKGGQTKNILCIGDSLTSSGVWVQQGSSRYTTAGGTINLLGTISSSGVKHEGRGGWQWKSYIEGYSTTPSPFKKNSGSGISFIDYCTNNGYTHIDELYILMTYNGVGGSFRTFSFGSEPFKSAKILIDQFHADFPDGKITLMGIPLPSVNGGLGAYYTINQSYGDNYGQFVTVLNYNRFLEDFAKMPEYSSFMRFVDVGGQFDSEYNMPTVGKPVNNQNSTTEPVGTSMGLHPSTNGYRQIGDTFYRTLCHEWN